ncbi:MAG TPA: FAD/NAD(P)-binding protein [Terriglobales bacterium]|nr:FAD/NAD(P)-binding protein [Terriglobales bacterium]
MADSYDRYLGMDRAITRRDFLNGAALAIGATLLPHGSMLDSNRQAEPQNESGYYPPTKTGMRGSHPGSFEIAHGLRDGTFWDTAGKPVDTGESYDLVVVGAGISGLAAAYFFRERAGSSARILLLENHDDFGGHAKRNQFHLGGGLQLLNGGTLLIDSPTPYSPVADGLLKKLGINPPEFERKFTDHELYRRLGLGSGVLFDKDTFGEDRLVVGTPGRDWSDEVPATQAGEQVTWAAFLAKAPLSQKVQRDIVRVEEAKIDYMPGLSSAEKKARLAKMSYRDFLLNVVKVDPDVIRFYQRRTEGEWGVGIDAEPALDCWALGLPGFQGMGLEAGAAPHMSYSAAGYANGGSYRFHFPDGNASIARLLVRALIPDALPGHTAEDVVTAQADYSRLDRDGVPIRLRLNSTVVGVKNIGAPASAKEVEITYATGKQVLKVHAKGCVLACWNMVIPYLCPELPDTQRQALHYLVKIPLVYASVGIRNWRSFQKLGVQRIAAPGCYWSDISLNWAVNMGDYRSPTSPEEPILVHLSRAPCKPGLPAREQHKIGRYELLTTSFEVFERNIRDQLARTLKDGGFDPARDIEAITVNRWPHGYGYEYNPLFDPDWPEEQRPNVIGRKQFGRISIANTDAAATAYTDTAIDQAYRAVSELIVV